MRDTYKKFTIQSMETEVSEHEYMVETIEDALREYTFERGEFVEELLRIECENPHRVTFVRATGRVIAQVESRTV